MKAVILAAGRGTRMKDLTDEVPKPMLKIDGKNLIEYKLDALPGAIKEVLIVVGYKDDVIRDYFGSQYGDLPITYIDMVELNGTGPAVHLCKDHLDDKFLVLNGDDIYGKDDLEFAVKHDLAILGYEKGDLGGADGLYEMDGLFKGLTRDSNLACVGAYVLTPDFFKYELVGVPGKNEFGLPHTIAKMAEDHEIRVERCGEWRQVTSPEDLR